MALLVNGKKYWGMETQIDLEECDPERVRSKVIIISYMVDICELIKMKRYGSPVVAHFGENEEVTGYTAFQLIETSSISGHFIEQKNSVCMNIFSCAEYDPHVASAYTAEYFGGKLKNRVITGRLELP